jgi:hypothetical protein
MTSATAQQQIQNPKKQMTNKLRPHGMTMRSSLAVSVIRTREADGCGVVIRSLAAVTAL